jgi:hypothetical protein
MSPKERTPKAGFICLSGVSPQMGHLGKIVRATVLLLRKTAALAPPVDLGLDLTTGMSGCPTHPRQPTSY